MTLTSNKTNLLVIRHGQTHWNVERRCQGQKGGGLNDTGIAQARAAGQKVKQMDLAIDAIYTSDLARTFETAQTIGDIVDVPVRNDRRLRELAQGAWEGKLYNEIEAEYRCFLEDPVRYPPPDGETLLDMALRVIASLNDIALAHPGRNVVVVSHELPIAAVVCTLARRPLQEWLLFAPGNGQIVELDWPPAKELKFKIAIETPVYMSLGERSSGLSEEEQRYRRRRRRLARLRLARSRRVCALFST